MKFKVLKALELACDGINVTKCAVDDIVDVSDNIGGGLVKAGYLEPVAEVEAPVEPVEPTDTGGKTEDVQPVVAKSYRGGRRAAEPVQQIEPPSEQ